MSQSPDESPDDDLTVVREPAARSTAGHGGAWTPAPSRRPTDSPTDSPTDRPVDSPTDRPVDGAGSAPWRADPAQAWRTPSERFVAPPPPAPPTRTGLRRTRIVVWLVAVVLVGLVAGWAWVTWLRPMHTDPNTTAPLGGASQPQISVDRGDEVVRRYLTALSGGDVATALALGADQGTGARDLIANSAYSASMASARISNIHVPQQSASATTISATYDIGARQVSTTYTVVRRDNLAWQLQRSTVPVVFASPVGAAVPLLVNGKTVQLGRTYDVLPGLYRVSTGLSFLSYSAQGDLQVDNLADTGSGSARRTHTIEAQLTPAGSSAILQATQAALDSCLASTQPAPAGCPFATASGGKRLVDVSWTLLNRPLLDVTPRLNPQDFSVGQVQIVVKARMSATVQTVVNGRVVRSESSPINDRVGTWRVRMSLLAADVASLHPRFTHVS